MMEVLTTVFHQGIVNAVAVAIASTVIAIVVAFHNWKKVGLVRTCMSESFQS
jgi:hypothetical protein